MINSDNTTDICQWYKSLEPALEDLCASQLIDAWGSWCNLYSDSDRQLVALCLMSGTDLADAAVDVLGGSESIDDLWGEIGCITDLGGNCGMSHEVAYCHALQEVEHCLSEYGVRDQFEIPDAITFELIEDQLGYMGEFDRYAEAIAHACETPEAVEIDGTTLRVTIHPNSEAADLWLQPSVREAFGALMHAIAKIDVRPTRKRGLFDHISPTTEKV